MSTAIVQLIFGIVFLTFIFGLFAAIFIKLFERSVSFGQASLVAGWSIFVSTLAFVVYFFIQSVLGLPRSIDGLAAIVWMALSGTLITRRLRTYGFEKHGWAGVGAKTMLSVLALSWVLVGVYYLVSLMT
jgi:hypothetical protein